MTTPLDLSRVAAFSLPVRVHFNENANRFIVNRSQAPLTTDIDHWISTCQRGSVYWWVGMPKFMANMRTFPAVVDDFGDLVEVSR